MSSQMLCMCVGLTVEEAEDRIKSNNYSDVSEFREDTFSGKGCGRCLALIDRFYEERSREKESFPP